MNSTVPVVTAIDLKDVLCFRDCVNMSDEQFGCSPNKTSLYI